MIEDIVLGYLNSKLGVPAYMEDDSEDESEYVLLEKTGSSEENYLCHSTLAIQSFSSSLYGAAKLNKKVKESMKEIIELDDICKCSLNGDYNYTKTSMKKYRYQAVFDIVHY